MDTIRLDGEWNLSQPQKNLSLPAHVPGCIHTDLLKAKIITDPFYRDDEKLQMWVGEVDWTYERSFEVSEQFLKNSTIQLECDGLDTLAEIFINGSSVGKADNQFRSWKYDIKENLKIGSNSIKIVFSSAVEFITKKQKERFMWHTGLGKGPERHRISGSNRIRKSQCNFGWDWGPMCVTAGIWQSISIVGYSQCKIDFVQFTQKLNETFSEAELNLILETRFDNLSSESLEFQLEILLDKTSVHSETLPFSKRDISVSIKNPELWWPNGMGSQSLYTFVFTLKDASGKILDTYSRRFGIRSLKLEQKKDEHGLTFQFAVNGKPFFAKGANWIPADVFVTNIDKEKYRSLLLSAKETHMNMLRVWGGGIYEPECFYDMCDEMGICIWQDFMFACGAYSVHEKDFTENIINEAIEQVKRLHHRACLAVWCGNNEIEDFWDNTIGPESEKMTWEEYVTIFDKMLPDIVKAYGPDTSYIPSSGHSPCNERKNTIDVTCGDSHLWDVWFYREPFEWYRTSKHRFCSEFGFQSFPQLATVETYSEPEDRNVTSYVMEHHQRSIIGNEAIIQYMCRWFRLPKNFEMMLWLSQILQGIAIKYGVDHWRRIKPISMGALYWQLNDCWPGPSWSSIDSLGSWKALHYMARKFYQPISVSILENDEGSQFEVFVANDTFKNEKAFLHVTIIDVNGKTIRKEKNEVTIPADSSKKIYTVDISDLLKKNDSRDMLLFTELEIDATIIASDISFSIKPKHLNLQDPKFVYSIQPISDKKFTVSLSCKTPALWTWIDIKGVSAKYSDLFFHCIPGKEYVVTIETKEALTIPQIKTKLKVLSLLDTY